MAWGKAPLLLVLLLAATLYPFASRGQGEGTTVEWVVSDGGGVEAGGNVTVTGLPSTMSFGASYRVSFSFLVVWFDWGSNIRPQTIEWFAKAGCLEETFDICIRNSQNITLGSSTVQGSFAVGQTFSLTASLRLAENPTVNGTMASLGVRIEALIECNDSSLCSPVGGTNPAQKLSFLRPESSVSFNVLSPTVSTNIIQNPSFENGVSPATGYPAGWGNWTKHGTPDSTITANNTRAVDGTYSARLDVGRKEIGFIAIYQSLPSALRFGNLSDRPDGLDFWFYLEQKYDGMGDFRVRILFGENVAELNYVFDPSPFLSYPNITNSNGNPLAVSILLYGYPAGQWHHFQRNLRADWEALGFSLDTPFPRIQFDALTFQTTNPVRSFAEIAWIDNVKVYQDVGPPEPTPDFAISATPDTLVVPPGSSGTSTITLTSLNGFAGPMSTTAYVSSSELTASLNPSTVVLAADGSNTTVLTVSVSSLTLPGSFAVTVSANAIHSVTILVTVPGASVRLERGPWSLEWQNSHDDGIIISHLVYSGDSVLDDARLPGILSTYSNNLCGPFYEELKGEWIRLDQILIEDLATGGFQIRAVYNVPGELFQQIWMFQPDGSFQGLLRISKAGCFPAHAYEARWRYSFSLAARDTLLSYDGSAWNRVEQETVLEDSGARDPAHSSTLWAVAGSRSFFFAPFDIPTQDVPGRVLAVADKPGETERTHAASETPYDFLNNENLVGVDAAFWYVSIHSISSLDTQPINETILTGLAFYPGSLPVSNVPTVGVWSDAYFSSNITDTSIAPGAIITVEVNVTNAPLFNAYELTLFYDPRVLEAVSIGEETGTVFDNPFVARFEIISSGALRLAVANLEGPANAGTGTLVHINFRIVGVGVSPLTLAQGTSQPSTFSHSWTRLTLGATPIDVATSDGYFKNIAGRSGPVADFTFTPAFPEAGSTITFDASSSFDPDSLGPNRGITEYHWDFDDGSSINTFSPIVTHQYASFSSNLFGNFSVRLTVVDIDGFQGMITARVEISVVFHDIRVFTLTPSPESVFRGENVSITVIIRNAGTLSETYSLIVRITLSNLTIGSVTSQISPQEVQSFQFTLDTSVLAPGFYTIEANASVGRDDLPANNIRIAVVQVTVPNIPPVASFTFPTTNPLPGDLVTFDGSSSFDPDGNVTSWFWNFGDGQIGLGPVTDHAFANPGNYTVTLTVTDNEGSSGFTTAIVRVLPRPQHDVAVTGLDAQDTAVSSQRVNVFVALKNKGSSTEFVDVTVYYDSHVAATVRGFRLDPGSFGFGFSVPWHTLGVPPGAYTMSASVALPTDENPADNTIVDGTITILPEPTLTVNPGSGRPGSRVTVHGSGFPAPERFLPDPFPTVQIVQISFEHIPVGIITLTGSEFTFTFNIPFAQPGQYAVVAVDLSTEAKGLITFNVLPAGGLEVTIKTGEIYFQGDTADIYVSVNLNGAPATNTNLIVQLTLTRPDGTVVSLTLTPIGNGAFKASYRVPTAAATGTYALNARASNSDRLEASGLRSFQVKPSWLTAQGPRIASASALAGIALVGAALWRKRYLRSRKTLLPS